MLNSFYRLYDPEHGLAERDYDAEYPYSRVSPGDRHPAIYNSWWDARAASLWFRWRDANSNGRWLEATLPNEAQHEYVARHGQSTYQQFWGDASFPASIATECKTGTPAAPRNYPHGQRA
jgi:formylglycine-generating enzyme required for sulfatase activity